MFIMSDFSRSVFIVELLSKTSLVKHYDRDTENNMLLSIL